MQDWGQGNILKKTIGSENSHENISHNGADSSKHCHINKSRI